MAHLVRLLVCAMLATPSASAAARAQTIQTDPLLPVVGTPLSLAVSGGMGTLYDWVAISGEGTPYYSVIYWAYLPPGQSAVSMPMPTPDVGYYEARLYCCNGWQILASSPFAVTPVALMGQDRIDALFGKVNCTRDRVNHVWICAPVPPEPPPVVAVPTGIVFNPAAPSIPADSPLGSPVSDIAVTMSDGSAFAGTLGFGAPDYNASGCFGIQASRVVVACALPPAGGVMNITVTASQ
jgi:hypothetical protein